MIHAPTDTRKALFQIAAAMALNLMIFVDADISRLLGKRKRLVDRSSLVGKEA